MRYILNGMFNLKSEVYWRVDDIDRMAEEERAGTFNPVANLQRFGVAINQHGVDHELAQKLVDAMNAVLE